MEQNLSRDWNYKDYLKFVLPPILSMIFISLYTIVDGMFVSRFVGTDAVAAINIVFPIYSLGFGISIMLAAGGSAIIGINLGKKNKKIAETQFSIITLSTIILGIILGGSILVNIKELVVFLGATPRLFDYCMDYGRIIAIILPFLMLKIIFEFSIRLDGKVNLVFFITVIGGVLNIIFDYIFIKIMGLGIAGAGYGTAVGIAVSLIISIAYYASGKSILRFGKPKFDLKFLSNVFVNGSSEMITDFSTAITTFMFNRIILQYAGEDGIAAISIIFYLYFFLVSLYIGLSMGIAPVISYNFGAQNYKKIEKTIKQTFYLVSIASVMIFVFSLLFGNILVQPFIKDNENVRDLAIYGFKLMSVSYLFNGFNIIGSGLFTAINNGKISAVLAIGRTLVFLIIGLLILPKALDLTGVWLATPFAEILTIALTLFFYQKYKYIYFKKVDMNQSLIDNSQQTS